MKEKLCLILLILSSNFIISQNKINIEPKDSNEENGFTMFLLDRAKPKIINTKAKILTNSIFEISILNEEDHLRIQYTNIFGQSVDTTYTNARTLSNVSFYVDKFIDYHEKSIIQNAIENNLEWILFSSWGHDIIENEKLVLYPKKGYIKYSYYLNGEKIKKGKIEITKQIINEISLFEKKLRLMKNADRSCNFGQAYRLTSGKNKIEFQDNSCSGFSADLLLKTLHIN